MLLNTIAWLAGSAESTINNIMSLIKSAKEFGKDEHT